jgi:plasmid stability protein
VGAGEGLSGVSKRDGQPAAGFSARTTGLQCWWALRDNPKWIHTGCIVVGRPAAMAKTLTLKNLPDALHARLSAAAKRHRRSLNNEAIVCLEAGLEAAVPSVEERLARIRALRDSLGPHLFDPDEIDAFKREGRA